MLYYSAVAAHTWHKILSKLRSYYVYNYLRRQLMSVIKGAEDPALHLDRKRHTRA